MRRCVKYVQVECSLADVKKGELYRLIAEPGDNHDSRVLFLATEDATPFEHPDYGTRHECRALRLGMIEEVIGVDQK